MRLYNKDTMKRLLIVGLLCMGIGIAFIVINCYNHSSTSSITINVNDSREKISTDINDKLLLQISQAKNIGIGNIGWEVEVLEKPVQPNSINLLYHSDNWHGPYPSHVLAWSFKEKYFPNNRSLSVKGYNYDVNIELIDCSTVDSGPQTRFKNGTIKITWIQK